MYRTKTCGELRLADAGQTVTISGWVQRIRKMGGMTFVDIRDRYGITQVVFNNEVDAALCEEANHLGREFVVQITGKVAERYAKNPEMPTGDIEIEAQTLTVLNRSEVPPFTIEDESDGGDDIRMKYRYLDLRRPCVRANIELRHRMTMEVRRYLDSKGFLEIETPMLVGSTPEGARDFVVPSRMNPGQFYALPQSPQTLKQLLMVSGMDRYFQIVKCFRDEDLRADRQPEFTQIDCEMSFVNQDDIINLFEGMAKHLFKELRGVELTEPFIRMPWADAMRLYGSDKPDLRFGMTFVELMNVLKGHGFSVFDNAAYIGGICATGAASYTRKQLDQLTDFVKRPQIGAKGMVYARVEADGNVKSSVDKFYTQETLQELKKAMNARPGDLILILSGDDVMKTRKQLCELRLEMGRQLGLRDKNKFACLWVVDFPMFEWSDEEQRLMAMHHPFTHPKDEDIPLLDTDPAAVRADAYDMVVNGVEVGGGSIRIHDSELQAKMFEILGFTPEKAQEQFGFLMNAFKYGAPPHGGLAYGLDRWVSLFAGLDSIRDCIAFPKNNSGRDVMLDAPAALDQKQLDELNLAIDIRDKE
ncbi:aspartate--tRNA ligase [Muribaculaceae bacterium Isolate-007 (NCI)]|uniref:aspartate--tRNA ligase n=1 Tax=Muribaculum intestinale TaxID=1796646 RepID=UPI000F4A9961|nr:aspartate--tRNA ligase [Muribaculum intestinale]ROT10986.1 aspartate--tRNA ligase [Muribaculaceae bacterium Isolate-100 (HZI)]RXE65737.1 aspartate--tRNA ligase [Muribaculaceae bacterium Isolate-007 (NCI)]